MRMPLRRGAYRLRSVPSLQIIYASTSGHTEYVVGLIAATLAGRVKLTVTRVELATAEMLQNADVLLLASGTWNTGGVEGQLNPHMHAFVHGPAKAVDLKGKKVAVIGLGDERYRYTARAGELLEKFVTDHGGTLLGQRLRLVNEPYGQEDAVKTWTKELSTLLA